MGLRDKAKPKPTQTTTTSNPLPTLSKRELETLLFLIKNSTFKGEDVESVYQLTLKLQQLYTNQK